MYINGLDHNPIKLTDHKLELMDKKNLTSPAQQKINSVDALNQLSSLVDLVKINVEKRADLGMFQQLKNEVQSGRYTIDTLRLIDTIALELTFNDEGIL